MNISVCVGDKDYEAWRQIRMAVVPGERCDTVAELRAALSMATDLAMAQPPERRRRCGRPDADVIAARRAGLLHDLGRVGVSAGIWGKPGPLSDREWEKVRLHPYNMERVLARPGQLARLGTLASLHHERLDGSGYRRGLNAASLPPGARIFAPTSLQSIVYNRGTIYR